MQLRSLLCPTMAAVYAFLAPSFAPGSAAARRPVPRLRPVTVEVQAMGARAPKATDEMRARMRDHVGQELRVLAEEHLLTSPRGYLVDGSIDSLDVAERPDGVEISCGVRLILSARGSGAMLAMTTGQASLKNPRRARGAAQQTRLELDVLDGAVRAASDELVQHFAARRKS